jgi:hypothetical protein
MMRTAVSRGAGAVYEGLNAVRWEPEGSNGPVEALPGV